MQDLISSGVLIRWPITRNIFLTTLPMFVREKYERKLGRAIARCGPVQIVLNRIDVILRSGKGFAEVEPNLLGQFKERFEEVGIIKVDVNKLTLLLPDVGIISQGVSQGPSYVFQVLSKTRHKEDSTTALQRKFVKNKRVPEGEGS